MVVKALIQGCKVSWGQRWTLGQGPDFWLSTLCSLSVHQPFGQSPVFQNGDDRDIKKAWARPSENSHIVGEIRSTCINCSRVSCAPVVFVSGTAGCVGQEVSAVGDGEAYERGWKWSGRDSM